MTSEEKVNQLQEQIQKLQKQLTEVRQENSGSTEIARVSIKLPSFWKENPDLWFANVESQFRTHKISQEQTMYDYVLQSLDQTIIPYVADLIKNPPANPYIELKSRIITAFCETDEHRLRKLLSGMQIGDQKPSLFLQTMRNQAGNQTNDAVLKSLFMDQLPEQVRGILVMSNETNLDKIAAQADKIVETIRPTSISAVTSHSNATSEISPIDRLAQQIDELNKKFENFSRGRTRERQNNFQPRGTSRSPSRGRNFNPRGKFCFYHHRFGNKATKCQEPCSWVRNQPAHNTNQGN